MEDEDRKVIEHDPDEFVREDPRWIRVGAVLATMAAGCGALYLAQNSSKPINPIIIGVLAMVGGGLFKLIARDLEVLRVRFRRPARHLDRNRLLD